MASQRSTQFVEEYGGTVGFYSYLAQRHKLCPLFLRRNLSYRREVHEAERRRLNGVKKTDHGSVQDRCSNARAARAGNDDSISAGADVDKARASDSSLASESGAHQKGKKETETASTRRSAHPQKKTAVVFRLRYQEGMQECVQKMGEIRCPWCDMLCGELEGLMCHLQASHDRFSYALDQVAGTPEIYVSVKPQSDGPSMAGFSFLSERCGGPPLHVSLSVLASSDDGAEIRDDKEQSSESGTSAEKKRKRDMSVKSKTSQDSSAGSKMASQKARKAPVQKNKQQPAKIAFEDRHFFRSQTCLPIDPGDMDYDSDDDVDDEWHLEQAERLMDEFEDVTSREKAFMKLWNRFVHRHAILADFHVPAACEAFASHFAPQLKREGLRDELLFHLFALWDFNLVDREQIVNTIAIVDRAPTEEEQAPAAEPSAKKQAASASDSAKKSKGEQKQAEGAAMVTEGTSAEAATADGQAAAEA